MDSLLDWASVCLPTILSVVGTILAFKLPHPRTHKLWYVGLVFSGLVISGITYFQQRNSRNAHDKEVASLNGQLNQLNMTVKEVKQEQISEVARRMQAEKDLQSFFSAIGDRTREGVVSDIKKSPINVKVNGVPARDRSQLIKELQERYRSGAEMVRKLGNGSIPDDQILSSETSALTWANEVYAWISKNMSPAAAEHFARIQSASLSYTLIGDHSKTAVETYNRTMNSLNAWLNNIDLLMKSDEMDHY